jgi:hypothetical protein
MRILVTVLAVLVLSGVAFAPPHTPEEPSSDVFEEWELLLPMQPTWVGVADTVYGYWQNGIWESVDKGESWSEIHHFTGYSECRALFVDSRGSILASRLSRGALQLGKYRGGASRTWSEPLAFECQEHFWKMCEDPLGGDLFVGEYAGEWEDTCAFIYKSPDGGDTWDRVYDGTERHVHFVAADPYSGYLYASIGDGEDRRKVMRSTDTGETWETIIPSTFPCSHPVSIVFTPSRRFFGSDCANNRVYSTSDDSVLVDNLVLTGDENTYVWCMSKNTDGVIVAGTRVPWFEGTVPGIYVSQDHGQNWSRVKNWGVQPERFGVEWMSNFDGEGYAYYHENVTGKTYRFRVGYQGPVEAEFPLGHPTQFLLGLARPNPFTRGTTIYFEIPKSVEVVLRIYDVAGRLVRVLEDSPRPPGRYAAVWDSQGISGACVAPGVYFCRLEAGEFTETRKVVLLR